MTTELATIEQKMQLIEFECKKMDYFQRLAETMAQSTCTIPDHFKNKPADCLALILKADRWNMDHYEVAQGTSLVNGTLCFNAQLINAVISSSTAINGRFKYEFGGDWEKIAGRAGMGKNNNGKYVPQKKWSDADELGLFVRVGAVLSGEDGITWGEPVYLAGVITRNSPLWVTAPKQQLAYLAMKYWARLYTPDVTMGVYDAESLEQPIERKEKEINPIKDDLNAMLSDTPATEEKPPATEEQPQPEKQPEPVKNEPSKFDEVKQYISEINDEATFNAAASAFNQAASAKLCTPQELQTLHELLTEKAG